MTNVLSDIEILSSIPSVIPEIWGINYTFVTYRRLLKRKENVSTFAAAIKKMQCLVSMHNI